MHENVPIVIRADNAESELEKFLSRAVLDRAFSARNSKMIEFLS